MSSHTDEEIRAAAIESYHKDTVDGAEAYADGLIARLNPPAIHPDVPVMYDQNGDSYVTNGKYVGSKYPKRGNIRVLIPEETAREIARRAITRHARNPDDVEFAMAEVDRDIADYRRNGPGDGHE